MEKDNKLLAFQKKIGAIKKDGTNPHFKSTYATLSQILGEVKPLLSEMGLTLLQPIADGVIKTVIFDDKDIVAESSIKLPDNITPQAMGSAITYYRRYTLASLLALEIEDDDGNDASTKSITDISKDKPWLNKDTTAFTKAIDHMSKGGSITDIENVYKLSKEIKDLLNKAIPQ